jgi:hypothetical protein
MDLRKIGLGVVVEWIKVAYDRDQWQTVVNMVMNLRILAPCGLLVGWLVRDLFHNFAYNNRTVP